jgi:hypothetical protein
VAFTYGACFLAGGGKEQSSQSTMRGGCPRFFLAVPVLRGFVHHAIRSILRCTSLRYHSFRGNPMSFKFELDRLTDYSTTDIVNAIRRVADLLGVPQLIEACIS